MQLDEIYNSPLMNTSLEIQGASCLAHADEMGYGIAADCVCQDEAAGADGVRLSYSDQLSLRTRTGQRYSARQNIYPGGPGQLFGYDYDPDTRVRKINVSEADIVRQVFTDAAAGVAVPDIVDNLNKVGAPTKKELAWNRRAVRRMLCNSSYIGKDFYGKTETLRSYDGRRISVKRPKELWIELTGFTPAIVPEIIFGRVQGRMGTP